MHLHSALSRCIKLYPKVSLFLHYAKLLMLITLTVNTSLLISMFKPLMANGLLSLGPMEVFQSNGDSL